MSAAMGKGRSEQVAHDSSTVKKINSLFSSFKTRQDGWEMLNSFLSQCPEEYILQFCVSWMQSCCKIDSSVNDKEYAITLLGNLFKISKNYQELKKSVSFFITTQYFDFFFKYFLNSQAGWDCTKNCLLFYRGACGAFQDSLQKHLTAEINKRVKIPVSIAECFALLPCTGGGGNDGINYKRNWKSQFTKILDLCHSILNDLYADAEEIRLQEYETTENTSRQPEKPETAEHLVTLLYNRITVLNCMLLNQYPAPKSIPPDLIFQLICRGLALSPKSLEGRPTTKLIALRKVLSEVHCIFLSLLKASVVACKNLLYPYSHLACKLIKQVLEWTDADSSYVSDKPIGELRICAYETLCNWLAVAGNGSCVEGISGAVISSAVKDIVTKKAVVFLKAKRQSKDQEPTTRRVEAIPDSGLCYPALKCLQFLLKFSGVSLKPEEHKFLQEMVVELLLEIQKTPTGGVIPPFDAPKCRQELYSLLQELVLQPCTKWPPPTHFALELFSRGVNDCSPGVSSFCSAALNFATIIIHPQYENEGFSTRETTEDRNFTESEITWTKEPSDSDDGRAESESFVENVVGNNEDSASVMTDPEEKLSDLNEEVIISSSEDSRATIPYSKEAERERENASVEVKHFGEGVEQVKTEESEETEKTEKIRETEEAEESQNDEEPIAKKPKVSEEALEAELLTSVKENQSDTPPSVRESKRKSDRSEDSETPQESLTPAETHPKKRYFLRSKTKGSAEESEDAGKSGSSPESGKSTPLKSLPQSTPVAQTLSRRKTRGPSRIISSSEAESKANDKDDDVDEENLKASFDDSLAD